MVTSVAAIGSAIAARSVSKPTYVVLPLFLLVEPGFVPDVVEFPLLVYPLDTLACRRDEGKQNGLREDANIIELEIRVIIVGRVIHQVRTEASAGGIEDARQTSKIATDSYILC
jgi:hypothetical protein